MTGSEDKETDVSHEDRPDLPEPWGMVGLFLGLVLAGVYFHLIISAVPNEYFPLHIILLIPIVHLFLGVPVVFEQYYWRFHDAQ